MIKGIGRWLQKVQVVLNFYWWLAISRDVQLPNLNSQGPSVYKTTIVFLINIKRSNNFQKLLKMLLWTNVNTQCIFHVFEVSSINMKKFLLHKDTRLKRFSVFAGCTLRCNYFSRQNSTSTNKMVAALAALMVYNYFKCEIRSWCENEIKGNNDKRLIDF